MFFVIKLARSTATENNGVIITIFSVFSVQKWSYSKLSDFGLSKLRKTGLLCLAIPLFAVVLHCCSYMVFRLRLYVTKNILTITAVKVPLLQKELSVCFSVL